MNTTESEITTCPVPKVVHRGESRNLRWVEGVHWNYPTNLYPFLCSLAVALARIHAITHAHTYKYSHTRTRESGSWEANATLSWQKSLIRQTCNKAHRSDGIGGCSGAFKPPHHLQLRLKLNPAQIRNVWVQTDIPACPGVPGEPTGPRKPCTKKRNIVVRHLRMSERCKVWEATRYRASRLSDETSRCAAGLKTTT